MWKLAVRFGFILLATQVFFGCSVAIIIDKALDSSQSTSSTPSKFSVLKDINLQPIGSYPSEFTRVGSLVFFGAETRTNGRQLWVTDGTADGTHFVKTTGQNEIGANPMNLFSTGSLLFYIASDNTSQSQLFRSDGSASGTFALTTGLTNIGAFAAINNQLLFNVLDTNDGKQKLWTSDGTIGGTHLLKDIDAGTSLTTPTSHVIMNNKMYFSADDGVNGIELWVTDGSIAGTQLVSDIAAGAASSNPGGFAQLNGNIYFLASDTTHGGGFWKSNGTAGGTTMVISDARLTSEFNALGIGGGPVRVANNHLYFMVDYFPLSGQEVQGMVVSDGTSAGTQYLLNQSAGMEFPYDIYYPFQNKLFVASIPSGLSITDPTGTSLINLAPMSWGAYNGGGRTGDWKLTSSFFEHNGKVFFYGSNADDSHRGLWVTDGTAGGSSILADFDSIKLVANLPNVAIFGAERGGDFVKYWATDGTAGGTIPLVQNKQGYSFSQNLGVVLGSQALFAATDPATGTMQVFISDGTVTGTHVLKYLSSETEGSYPYRITQLGTLGLFVADDGIHGNELWKTDGTSAGTTLVKDINPTDMGVDGGNTSLVALGNFVYFGATESPTASALYKSDGTEAGTTAVYPLGAGGMVTEMKAVNGKLLFSGFDGALGTTGLYVSNGTNAGTSRLVDAVSITNLTVVGSTLYFDLYDGAQEALWKSNGTVGGTQLVKAIAPRSISSTWENYDPFTVLGAQIYFQTDDGIHGPELWKSNGTAAGTVMVKDINPSTTDASINSDYQSALAMGGVLYFAASDGTARTLWRTDGSSSGTFEVKRINPSGDAAPRSFVVFGNQLIFTADDGVHGRQIWKTDGTPTGTVMVSQLPGGFTDSEDTLAFGNKVYLKMTDAAHGGELWQTDGTPEGTSLVEDLNPGPSGSDPRYLQAFGSSIIFKGTISNIGRELMLFTP